MVKSYLNRESKWIYVALLWFGICMPYGHAVESDEQQIDQFLTDLSAIGRFSPVEDAGAHGSIGVSLGAGYASYQISQPNLLHSEKLNIDDNEQTNFSFPEFYLTKGLIYPFDIGITFGKSDAADLTKIGGYVQWTIYQSFKMPFFAIRGSYNKINNLNESDFSSSGLDALISYGLLSFLTIYAGYGGQYNVVSIEMPKGNNGIYLIYDEDHEGVVKQSWLSESQLLGIKLLIIPPFIAVTAEGQRNPTNDQIAILAKVSAGI